MGSVSIYNQKPTPQPGWYATAVYRMLRKLGLWSNITGRVV